MKTILSLFLVGFTQFAPAAIVTLTSVSERGVSNIAELVVGPYELAEVISFPRNMNYQTGLHVKKDGLAFVLYSEPENRGGAPFFEPLFVAGPATLRLVPRETSPDGNEPGPYKGLCTIRITPEAYPPDRALLVPPGTNQARITLECSTNLVSWFSATNGVYGPLPEAKFFRIKLEPVQ